MHADRTTARPSRTPRCSRSSDSIARTREEWEQFLEFSGTQVAGVPLPKGWQSLAPFGRELSTLARRRAEVGPEAVIAAPSERNNLSARIETARRKEEQFLNEVVAAQERLDFEVYRLFGLTDSVPEFEATIQPGSRRFEVDLARDGTATAWFARHNYRRPDTQAAPLPEVADEVRIIEKPTFKRRWLLTDWDPRIEQARRSTLLGHVEAWSAGQEPPRIEHGRLMARYVARGNAAAEPILPEGEELTLASWLPDEAVPFLAAHRFTDSGLAKHTVWQETWALQRREDAGENVGALPVPPKYDSKDYRDARYWRLRGKLDVPKERFIAFTEVPGRSGVETLYGWAGWTAQQRVKAILAIDEELEDGSVPLADRIGLLDSAWRLLPDVAREDAAAATRLKAELQALVGPEGPSRELIEDWKKRFPPPTTRTARAKKAPAARDDEESDTEESDES